MLQQTSVLFTFYQNTAHKQISRHLLLMTIDFDTKSSEKVNKYDDSLDSLYKFVFWKKGDLAKNRASLHFYGIILVKKKGLCIGLAWLPFQKQDFLSLLNRQPCYIWISVVCKLCCIFILKTILTRLILVSQLLQIEKHFVDLQKMDNFNKD